MWNAVINERMVLTDSDRHPIAQTETSSSNAGAKKIPPELFEACHREFSLGEDVLANFQDGEKDWPSPAPDRMCPVIFM